VTQPAEYDGGSRTFTESRLSLECAQQRVTLLFIFSEVLDFRPKRRFGDTLWPDVKTGLVLIFAPTTGISTITLEAISIILQIFCEG
jgi:hypothetical protein